MASRRSWLWPKTWLISLVRLYQRRLSPAKPPCCRFSPTCSAYAEEAHGRYGMLVGGALALWRILRCNPLCKGGYDPVPEHLFRRRARR